ncbi:MAG: hypothetical protein ACP5Q1_03005 [Anaerolineae bacterium]
MMSIAKFTRIWDGWRGKRTRTLLYHSIADDPTDPLAVSPSGFVQQMEWLAHHGFRVISTEELRRAIYQAIDLPRTVVLTFETRHAISSI